MCTLICDSFWSSCKWYYVFNFFQLFIASIQRHCLWVFVLLSFLYCELIFYNFANSLINFGNFCFVLLIPWNSLYRISSCLQTEMVLFLVSKLYGFYFLLTYCLRWPFFSTMFNERDENRAKSPVTITVLLGVFWFCFLFFNIYVMQSELISIMLPYWPLWFGSRTCLIGCDLE